MVSSYIQFAYFHRGGLGGVQGFMGENGSVSGRACPVGLYGTFCEVIHIASSKKYFKFLLVY